MVLARKRCLLGKLSIFNPSIEFNLVYKSNAFLTSSDEGAFLHEDELYVIMTGKVKVLALILVVFDDRECLNVVFLVKVNRTSIYCLWLIIYD